MHKIRIISVFVCLVAIAGMAMGDVRNPGATTSGASRYPTSTVPQGQYDSTNFQLGNDIVTGNVGGGKHFRGVVPYGSAYEFQGVQGSSNLNDFYRRAASVPQGGTQDYQPQTQRYYLPSTGVTSVEGPGGTSGLNMPRIETNPASSQINLAEPTLKKVELQQFGRVNQNLTNTRPLDRDLGEVKSGLEKYLQNIKTPAEDGTETTGLTEALQDAKAKTTFFEPLTAKPVTTIIGEPKPEPKEPSTKFQSRFEKPSEEETLTLTKEQPKQDMYSAMLEKIKKQFDEGIEAKRLEKLQLTEEEKLAAIEKQKQRQEQINKILNQRDAARNARMQEENKTEQELAQQEQEAAQEEIELPDTIKSFAVPDKDMFSVYMNQAEKFMKDGMFYKAADAYALASAYQNMNPLPYMGRSIALFAAGEYMSSSYYLNMSLRIFEEIALFKVSIKDFIGNEDIYNKRLNELMEIQIQSGSPEMRFLMAYIYYVDNQPGKALDAINDASTKLADDAAVQTLKQAILKNQ